MALIKQIGVLLLLGFLVGAVLATLIAPSFLEWYNTGANANIGQCNCTRLTHDVTSSLIRAQVIGGFIGGVFFTIAGVIVSRMRASKKPATPPATPPTT